MPLTQAEIITTLSAGDFDKFIGEVESEYFDAKGQPYVLDTDAGKREASKDASAFANGGGGYILLGLRTKPSSVRHADEVDSVRPIPEGLVNTAQLRAVLDAWIYPPIDGLDIKYYASRDDGSKGLVAIEIPPQREELKPFLIVRSFEGDRLLETMFGYAQRRADLNAPLGVADLHRLLRSGRHYERDIAARFDRIEAILATRENPEPVTRNAEEVLDLLVQRIANELRGGNLGRNDT